MAGSQYTMTEPDFHRTEERSALLLTRVGWLPQGTEYLLKLYAIGGDLSIRLNERSPGSDIVQSIDGVQQRPIIDLALFTLEKHKLR